MVFASWEEDVGTDDAIFVSRYAQGEGWSAAERISADLHDNPFDVAFAVDRDGNALLVYDIDGNLIFANQYIAGQGWGGVHDVTSGDRPRLEMTPNGAAFLVFRRFSGLDPQYYSIVLK